MKKLSIIILFLGSLMASCDFLNMSNFYMQDGKAEIVSVSDSLLNDSSLFVGYIYDLDYSSPDYPAQAARVWIESTSLSTTPDSTGHYSIKTLPGTYTVKCERDFNKWPELIEEVKNVAIKKNQSIHINFYLGGVSQ